MQKTGNIDPATGKEEYVAPDGSKVSMSPEEFTRLSSLTGGNILNKPNTTIPQIPLAPAATVGSGASGSWDVPPTPGGIEVLGSDESIPVDLMSSNNQPPAPMPSGMVDVSESTRTSKVIPKDVLKKQENAFKKAEEAITAKMDAETSVSNAVALKAQEEAAMSQRFLDQEAEKQASEQADIERRQAELDAISAEYSGMEIDSNNYWAKKSTGDSILAALAIGLGTFGHVASGAQGESPVLKILQSKIDQDIEIQKANMAKAGSNVATQRGLFSDVLNRTGDERIARLKTHELGLKSALAQFDQQIAKSNNELVMAKYQQEKAAIENELANNLIAQADQLVVQSRTVPTEAAKDPKGLETLNSEFATDAGLYIDEGRKKADESERFLTTAMDEIAVASKGAIAPSGRFVGLLPEVLKPEINRKIEAMMGNEAIKGMADAFGPQFTQAEGAMYRQLAYDPKASPESNLDRMNRRLQMVRTARLRKEDQIRQFEANNYSVRGLNLLDSNSPGSNFTKQKKN